MQQARGSKRLLANTQNVLDKLHALKGQPDHELYKILVPTFQASVMLHYLSHNDRAPTALAELRDVFDEIATAQRMEDYNAPKLAPPLFVSVSQTTFELLCMIGTEEMINNMKAKFIQALQDEGHEQL